ncbi:hypothetical protein [Curtobacterium sp. RRHDQ10]|uniref:hypothetical protein n=1 Tax=Curtobacterium phyllosphaerae TaxID=3413379 RepID=UPI003BF04876
MLELGTYRNECDAVIVVERLLADGRAAREDVYAARTVDITGALPDEGLLVTEHALHDAGYRLADGA